MLELVIGGARSGKSHYAQQQAAQSGLAVVYIATATVGDAEMQQRIAQHRAERPTNWTTLETPITLADSLTSHYTANNFIIVDCLTLWLTNLLAASDEVYERESKALLACLGQATAPIIFVSNEVGMGIVPMGALTRRFVDETGRLHQQLAQQCHRVTQMIAGIANVIKDEYRN